VTLPNEWIIHPRIDFDKLPMVRSFTRFGSVDHDVVSISVSDPTPGYSSPFGCDRVGVTFRMSLYLPLYRNKSLTHTLEQGATKKKNDDDDDDAQLTSVGGRVDAPEIVVICCPSYSTTG